MGKAKNITQIYGSRPFEGRLPFVQNVCRFLILGTILILQTSFLSSPSSFSRSHPASDVYYQASSLTHAFHTSITEMRYNPKAKTFEISLRVFTDDLEKTLSINNQNKKFLLRINRALQDYGMAKMQT